MFGSVVGASITAQWSTAWCSWVVMVWDRGERIELENKLYSQQVLIAQYWSRLSWIGWNVDRECIDGWLMGPTNREMGDPAREIRGWLVSRQAWVEEASLARDSLGYCIGKSCVDMVGWMEEEVEELALRLPYPYRRSKCYRSGAQKIGDGRFEQKQMTESRRMKAGLMVSAKQLHGSVSLEWWRNVDVAVSNGWITGWRRLRWAPRRAWRRRWRW